MSDQTLPHYANGKICYIEIPSRDVHESASFYQTVFGWSVRTRDDGSVAFDDTVGQVSGTWRTDRKPVTELGTFIHLMVDDMQTSIKAVTEHGGTVVLAAGMEPPEMTARIADPSGNVFGLYQQ